MLETFNLNVVLVEVDLLNFRPVAQADTLEAMATDLVLFDPELQQIRPLVGVLNDGLHAVVLDEVHAEVDEGYWPVDELGEECGSLGPDGVLELGAHVDGARGGGVVVEDEEADLLSGCLHA